MNTEELGRAVRRKREELSASLRDVADATGVSASTLSRIENGTGKPDADNIARLTTWLDVPMERIMGSRPTEGEDAKAVVYLPPRINAGNCRSPSPSGSQPYVGNCCCTIRTLSRGLRPVQPN